MEPIRTGCAVTSGSQDDALTAHRFLRSATHGHHRAVEDALSTFDLESSAGLTRFLLAQAAAVLPIEAELDGRGVIAFVADWPARRRGAALEADLAVLGHRSVDTIEPPALDSAARMLGALYVLEGSRLGGRLLARTVEASRDHRVRQATSYLRHFAGFESWTGFLTVLNGWACPRDELLSGAVDTFRSFERAATGHSRRNGLSLPLG